MRGEGGVHAKGDVSGEVRGACRHTRRGMGDVRGVCVEGGCVAGETATAANGTHPTGMHSTFKHIKNLVLKRREHHFHRLGCHNIRRAKGNG